MPNDSGEPERPAPTPPFDPPRILAVSFRRVQFAPPERRNFSSALPGVEDAVEFVVETDAPFPVRALGPALYVGDVPITEVIADDPTHYRFTALAPENLRSGAAIGIGWSDPGAPRLESDFTYD